MGCSNTDFSTDDDLKDLGIDQRLENPFVQVDINYDTGGDAETCSGTIDLVFVLDVSSSMGFVLDTLANEIDKVVSASNALAADSHFGLVAYVDNHLIDATGPLSGGIVHTESSTLKNAFQFIKGTYTLPNRNPGDGPSGPTLQNPICEENALDALYDAAQKFPWRANANRVIIVATDDTFIENPDNYGDRDGDGKTDQTDYPSEGDYPAKYTLSEAVNELVNHKIRVFSFTRLYAPSPFDLNKCSTGRRRPWEDISAGWSKPYDGAPTIADATQGQNFDIDAVRFGTLSLTETINNMVLESQCDPIE